MNESYAEFGVKRKQIMKNYLLRALMIFLVILLFTFGNAVFGIFSMTIAIAVIAICYFWFPRMNVEYEYVYCDGQLDFDRISGNAKRKTMLRIDFDKVEMVAPVKSHTLDSYKNNPQLKVKDFTSLKPDANVYALILREEGITKVLFEPNEKIIECIKQKTPRKISTF